MCIRDSVNILVASDQEDCVRFEKDWRRRVFLFESQCLERARKDFKNEQNPARELESVLTQPCASSPFAEELQACSAKLESIFQSVLCEQLDTDAIKSAIDACIERESSAVLRALESGDGAGVEQAGCMSSLVTRALLQANVHLSLIHISEPTRPY